MRTYGGGSYHTKEGRRNGASALSRAGSMRGRWSSSGAGGRDATQAHTPGMAVEHLGQVPPGVTFMRRMR